MANKVMNGHGVHYPDNCISKREVSSHENTEAKADRTFEKVLVPQAEDQKKSDSERDSAIRFTMKIKACDEKTAAQEYDEFS